MKPTKSTLPFVLILGLTAGSTAAYAQTQETAPRPVDTQVEADLTTEAEDLPTADADVADGEAADAEAPVTAQDDGSLEPEDETAATEADVSTSLDTAMTEDGLPLNGIHTLASTEDLVGATIYDSEENAVGDITAILPADGSGEEQIVIGMGGFLGFGEKPVAISASTVRVAVDADGAIERVMTTHTQVELDAMPEVEM